MLQCPRCRRQFPDDVYVCSYDFTPLQADATIADVPLDPLIGHVFDGKYRLDERLGGGGMGTVYRATHLLIDRPVALKVLSQRFIGDETAQQRFRREARAAGRMQHPNAVTVTDFGATSDGYLYIVMELLEGQTLRDLLAREGPLDPARAVSFMLQACAAVGAAHEAKLIHRDLKPANIFIEQRPNVPATVKVLDFGVAKFAVEELEDDDYQTLTQVGAIVGTPRYMSPEQCSGAAPLTSASDVYSLGLILYEMLTGAAPFSADTPLAMAMKHVSEPPRPPREIVPSIPTELELVVLHALAKNPVKRPADANKLRSELHATAEHLGLEHADSIITPTMAALREAGTESPSGRLLIDLATLRQVQAASSGDSLTTAAVQRHGESRPTAPTADNTGQHPEFDRVAVPLQSKTSSGTSPRVLIGGVALIALFVIVAVAAITSQIASHWLNSSAQLNGYQEPVVASTPSPSPTPSPTPAAGPRQNREVKNHPRKESKKPSKLRSIVNRVKGIFKK